MSFDRRKYLGPSGLCDFDRSPAITRKALELVAGCRNRQQKFESIFRYVKELPYGLEDWDLKASDTLNKGWGMCSGKTNLLVALLRAASIPARYRIYRIKADSALWSRLAEGSGKTGRMNELGEERDHVDCEAWLGKWVDCDPGRDPALEEGMLKLGGRRDRIKVADAKGIVRYVRLAEYDDWVRERQKHRTFRSDRVDVFSEVNKGFDAIRELGKSAS
jgi:transglutaminase-like putative cysteine protease